MLPVCTRKKSSKSEWRLSGALVGKTHPPRGESLDKDITFPLVITFPLGITRCNSHCYLAS